ncbi:hydrogenase maturation protease [Rhodoblastus acidophilus]|uniref:hydrogenase maturation protease n=1 Tax=Rhodoblastus acidophilus TaxID=1074 RepID=UPI0022258BF3|nr:hydrogenase maturation protease [Rhodoblastus acidophilus]MCW2314500.1 hydrogenase maturation protease [Rhodoblastus acidophilus]
MIRRRILCFGNPLHGDDGVGAAVFAALSARKPPEGLEVIEAGTPGPAALALFEDCDEAIVVDALAPAGSPGRVAQLAPEGIDAETTPAPHGMGLGYILRALNALPGPRPEIRIIGIEAASHRPFQPGLSPAVARAAGEVARLLGPCFEDGHG